MPQLDPTSHVSQVFWLIIAFVTLYVLLANYTIPKIAQSIQFRDDTVSAYLSRAEDAKLEAEILEEEYNAKIRAANNQAKKIEDEALHRFKDEMADAIAELDKKMDSKLKEAENMIALNRKELDQDLDKTAAIVAGAVIEKLTNVKISDEYLVAMVAKSHPSAGGKVT